MRLSIICESNHHLLYGAGKEKSNRAVGSFWKRLKHGQQIFLEEILSIFSTGQIVKQGCSQGDIAPPLKK